MSKEPLPPGTLVSHYRILSRLGAGGMGEVYRAQDEKLDRDVALKILPPEVASNQERMRRFVQEAKAASALSHPNVAHIYEIGDFQGISFIAMEYVEGQTLDLKMAGSPLGASEIIELSIQVADALEEAHSKGVIHRDIKSANIMITPRGQAKVLDFGLAKVRKTGRALDNSEMTTMAKTESGVVLGTVQYMSPEQALGHEVDHRTDIFSLGVVLYEMATGRRPFSGASTTETLDRVLHAQPEAITRFNDQVPLGLERVVRKCLEKDRERRHASARDLLTDLRNLKRDSDAAAAIESGQALRNWVLRWKQAPRQAGLILVVALLVLGMAALFYWRRVNLSWAKSSVPRIEELASAERYFEAYNLAVRISKYLPDEPALKRLMPVISDDLSVLTEPPGARVHLKRFSPDESGSFPARQLVGTTPLNQLAIARGEYVLHVEKEGYAPFERTISSAMNRAYGGLRPTAIRIEAKLIEAVRLPERMVFVPGGEYKLVGWGLPTDETVRLDDYFIDQFEVTNREYKDFVNAGGYLKKQFWKYPFFKEGKVLSWDEAMREFKDRTTLPGPRSWSNQNFPEGKENHPVTDIIWYEAAAYAAFKGTSLPTIFQWEKAARDGAFTNLSGSIMPWGWLGWRGTTGSRANFLGSSAAPVDSFEFGMSPSGCYNMAGNVAEWCLNQQSQGFTTAGGSWADPSYTFGYYGALPSFYSSNKLGFRCVLNSPQATGDQGAMRIHIEEQVPTYAPSSESSFKSWLTHYRYDQTPLNPAVEEVEEIEAWRREKLTYAGADDERAIAYLYLPKNFDPPFQVIHYMPSSGAFSGRSVRDEVEMFLVPYIKSGRAVFAVVLKGFIERSWPPNYIQPEGTSVKYRDQMVNWTTDQRRGLDYLETRKDIDARKIAYCGLSWGAASSALVFTAVEDRFRSVILFGGGLRKHVARYISEANGMNFAPHIRAPKLMLNGRYDEAFRYRTEIEPLFKLLREPKRLALFDGGHSPPLEVAVPIVNEWLDETLGPVRRP